ncbi:MAG: shikimate kinase [Cyanobacteria bacterium J06648_11]
MARRLCDRASLAHLSLDAIAWNEGVERKPLADSVAALREFIEQRKTWVIEGCYGDLIEAALPYCTELRFLNPGIETCVAHCLNRPWEPDKYASEVEQQAGRDRLIQWVRDYETRDDEFGLQRHQRIFERFQGAKREFASVAEYE